MLQHSALCTSGFPLYYLISEMEKLVCGGNTLWCCIVRSFLFEYLPLPSLCSFSSIFTRSRFDHRPTLTSSTTLRISPISRGSLIISFQTPRINNYNIIPIPMCNTQKMMKIFMPSAKISLTSRCPSTRPTPIRSGIDHFLSVMIKFPRTRRSIL